MFKKIFLIFFIFLILLLLAATIERPTMHHFRFMGDGVADSRKKIAACQTLNWDGATKTKLAGSGALKFSYLKKAVLEKQTSIYLLNVEFNPEELLYYKNNHVKSYFGLVLNKDGGFSENPRPWYKKARYYIRRILVGLPPCADQITKVNFTPITEEVYFEQFAHVHYFNVLPQDWLYNPLYIDELVMLFQSIPDDGLVYIHCRHGRGRTTTFMVIYDLFKNHDKLTFDEIITRHYCLGGENIFEDQAVLGGSWTQQALTARRKLVEVFYDYMQSPTGYHANVNWSDWLSFTGHDQLFKVTKYKNGK